jgi:hypothetical protein
MMLVGFLVLLAMQAILEHFQVSLRRLLVPLFPAQDGWRPRLRE